MPDSIRSLVRGDTATNLIVVLVGAVAALLFMCVALAVAVRKQSRRVSALARNAEGEPLESILVSYMDSVDSLCTRLDGLERATDQMRGRSVDYMQRFNLVHYDAFENIGGQQSFSLALVNGRGTGVVVTSVYSRNHMHIYAKGVENGRASQSLSEEEQRVLNGVLVSSSNDIP